MPRKPPTWITLWLLFAVPVVLWDAGYCLARPRSFKGGSLHWIWKPYEHYENVDYYYGPKAYAAGEGFTNAQAALNLIETALNVVYLHLVHVSQAPSAPLVGFVAALGTLSKTVLYFLQEYYCHSDHCLIGNHSLKTIFFLWVIPDGVWIVMPALVVYRLGKDIIGSLNRENAAIKKTK